MQLLRRGGTDQENEMSVIEGDQTTEPPCAGEMVDHTVFRCDPFWQQVPGFTDVSEETFASHTFQIRNTVTSIGKLMALLGERVDASFYEDVTEGLRVAPMAVRLSPYLLGLIDWDDPYSDPIRRQFLPLASTTQPDHPELQFDSLNEQADSPVPGLTHRYPDRALFLTLDTCPVYCRYCTRSYAVGLDTEEVEKVHVGANRERWERVFTYVRETPQLEDLVISGGDTYNLRAEHIRLIGNTLLDVPHVRRMRFASRGPAALPQKILTDDGWTDALVAVVTRGREMNKEVVLHTHFNHPNEMTGATQDAMNLLSQRGVTVRNQAVLQRGVNDDLPTMQCLTKRLAYLNVQPYYVFFHDLVSGVEDLRTTLQAGLNIEKGLRGTTAGFNTPTFIVDTLGGGGKRDGHSYEYYDSETGIAVFTSPTVRPAKTFFYYDPINTLSEDAQARWNDPNARVRMKRDALEAAGL